MSTKNPNRSGIRDIAKLAGVSTATVSRVLNNPAQVRTATRDKVLAAVSHSDYRPNAAAKALATRRTRTIAAVIPTLEYSIFAVFMNALEDSLASAGYSLVIATHGFDIENEHRRCSDVLKMGAEALVVSGAIHNDNFYRLLKSTNVPCVYTSVYNANYDMPSIGYDNQLLAEQAMSFLASKGYKRITVIHGDTTVNDRMALRVAGAKAMARENKKLKIEFKQTSLSIAGGTAAANDILSSSSLPDACLCCADVFAQGMLFEAQRHGLVIPDQISLMGFEDQDWASQCEPRLTTVALPAEQMGIATAESLVSHLEFGKQLTHQLFEGKIIERESTGVVDKKLT